MMVNGEERTVREGCTLAEFLDAEGYRTERVVTELNLEIVPKSEYETTVLKDSDSLEILSFVGGG